MSKSYYSSGRPKVWGGTSTEHSSIVVAPRKYRAAIELPKATADGTKLHRKGGKSSFQFLPKIAPPFATRLSLAINSASEDLAG